MKVARGETVEEDRVSLAARYFDRQEDERDQLRLCRGSSLGVSFDASKRCLKVPNEQPFLPGLSTVLFGTKLKWCVSVVWEVCDIFAWRCVVFSVAVSKRNPNRCFVMSLPFVHSLWPAFAAQAAVVCIFKKQTLAADTPVQMQALRLRYSCAWLRMEDPVFDISVCAQHTQHVHDIIHLLAGLLPHPATVSGPLLSNCPAKATISQTL
eukprot:symbB.v1.2.009609.t1/scaffold613.1/size180894/17